MYLDFEFSTISMTADCITYKNSIKLNALIFLDGMINISFCSFDVIYHRYVEISVRVKFSFLS